MSETGDPQMSVGNPYIKELLNDAPCAFLVSDLNERVLYANDTLGHWIKHKPSDIESGFTLKDILTKESHLLFQTQVGPMIQLQGFAREVSCNLRVADSEEPIPVLMNAVFRPGSGNLPERIDFALFNATERTRLEQRLRERQKEAEELAVIVRNANVGILRCDADGVVKRFNRAAAKLLGVDEETLPSQRLSNLLDLDGEKADWFADAIKDCGTDHTFDASRQGCHFNITVGEIPNPEEPHSSKEYSIILRDVTKRVQADQRMELLVHELNHRIKNVFAVVSGLIRQSLPASLPERQKILDRIHSAAVSHDILTRNFWKDASIQDAFLPIKHQVADGQSVSISGPDLQLKPHQFKALSMAAHELATNSRKYGALGADAGKVAICWKIGEVDGAKKSIELSWRESDGPPVKVPESSGFGTLMIERVLADEFDGTAKIHFRPEGVELEFRGVVAS